DQARAAAQSYDFLADYVDDLPDVLDIDAIRDVGVRIGADPLGGASVDYWGAIAERHRLDLTVVNDLVDPTWRFMTLDWDGKIRMDCSSPAAMASLIDRVVAGMGRRLVEVPVGFKWFVPGLLNGSVGFGGEESAGASFLRRDGSVWTTDKDGILLALLASEIQAVTGRSPSELHA